MKRIIVGISALISSTGVFAQFSGQGNGTEKDPYLVSNADELFEVRNDLNAYYKQTEDIDLTEWIQDNNANQGWSPIGTSNYPFSGYYDGNMKTIKGLYIKRPSSSYVGFFGYVHGAIIKNMAFINPKIEGGENVGTIVGFINDTGVLSNNIICCGSIIAQENAGGIVGKMGYSGNQGEFTAQLTGNYVHAQLKGEIAGGICGVESSEYFICPGYTLNSIKIIEDNSADCSIEAKIGGGILGKSDPFYDGSTYYSDYSNDKIERNISQGIIYAEGLAGGIIGSYNVFHSSTRNIVDKNCAILSELSSSSAFASRICNYDWTGYKNIANATMKVISNGKEVAIEDDGYNGTGYGLKTLKRKSTYEGLGFDTNKQWAILEGESYAYNINQCSPAKVSSFTSGSKGVISGDANGNGIVYILVNDNLYEAAIVDGQWSANVGNIAEDTRAYVCVKTGNSMPSIVIEVFSGSKDDPINNVKLGDSNSDGVVDAADVVGTINYILGKPSPSFNEKNADANGDGQILVDDAVSTVNLIMNNQ